MEILFSPQILPPHIAEMIGHFTGRGWLPKEVLAWYHDDTQPPLFLIVGQPGTGKSMIAAWLASFGDEPDDPETRANLHSLRSQVAGAHFCQVDSDMSSPKMLADQLARQLTRRVEGFDAALNAVLGEALVNIQVETNIQTIASGGSFTGVQIDRLDLGKLLGPGSVERALIHPLRRTYEQGFNKKILLIIDSMDEANLYKGDYMITDTVLELAKMNLPIRILVTSRNEPNVLAAFRAYPRLELTQNDPRDLKDISDYVDRCLNRVGDPRAIAYGQRIKESARGNFLFAHLVIQDMLERLAKHEQLDLDDIPSTLTQHYHESMRRLSPPSQWQRRYGKLFGLTAVAQDTGFDRSQLANFLKQSADGVLPALQAIKPFLEGALNDGPFHSFHKSFTDFLLEDEDNFDYKIDPAVPHAGIVYYYWPPRRTAPPVEDWDEYAHRHIVTHLAGASASLDENERHRMAQRLVETVCDPVLKDIQVIGENDLADTARRLRAALETACRDDLLAGLPLVMRAVRAYQAFYNAVLQPAHIFNHAKQGETATALDKLSLFSAELRWRKAALLAIAWLAAPANRHHADMVLGLVSTGPPFPAPLDRLKARVEHAFGGPPPQLVQLPKPPDQQTIEEIFAAMLGNEADLERVYGYLYDNAVPHNYELNQQLQNNANEITTYQALEYAPIFVSFAGANASVGDEFFDRYLTLEGSNLYIYYRNQTLWITLEAVLRHPNEHWARQRLRDVLEWALTGERKPFEENVPLALLGLRAASDAQAAAQLDQRRTGEEQAALELSEERRNSDIFGAHKRRLCALALAYRASATPLAQSRAAGLLQLAMKIPRGYAGLLYKAWLTLYETLQICGGASPADEQHCLEEAMRCAQKINDPNFCVLATARMRRMLEGWPTSQADIRPVVEQFALQPLGPDFAPLFRVGDHYPLRNEAGAPMPPLSGVAGANTIQTISELLGLSMEGLLELNEGLQIEANSLLPAGTIVRLQDPEFVPHAAQRLSADVVVAGLPPRDKRRLLQLLIPHALSNPTALDTILGRLIYVSGAKDLDALDIPIQAHEN